MTELTNRFTTHLPCPVPWNDFPLGKNRTTKQLPDEVELSLMEAVDHPATGIPSPPTPPSQRGTYLFRLHRKFRLLKKNIWL